MSYHAQSQVSVFAFHFIWDRVTCSPQTSRDSSVSSFISETYATIFGFSVGSKKGTWGPPNCVSGVVHAINLFSLRTFVDYKKSFLSVAQ